MELIRKHWVKLALAGGAAVCAYAFFSGRADAADLSGGCCSDLEERIAELEATTARKGNRKVSVVVAGQINKALFYYDADDFGLGSDTHVIENGTSESFLSISGAALVRPGFWAGYTLEIGQGQTGIGLNLGIGGIDGGVATNNDLYTRQSYAFLKSDDLGTLSIGLQSMATDDLVKQGVARTDAASKRLTWQPIGGVTVSVLGIDLLDIPLEPFNGRKANAVKYSSPVVAGFSASAAWSSDDDSWDAALRWSGEGLGFQAIASVGYYDDKANDIIESLGVLGPAIPDIGSTTLTVNGGVKHVASGLFAQGTWARLEFDVPAVLGGGSIDTDSYHVQAGWEGRLFAVGQSTIFAEYSEWDDLSLKFYGVGLNQQLGDAVDAYLLLRRYEVDLGAGGDIDTVTSGVRIRF